MKLVIIFMSLFIFTACAQTNFMSQTMTIRPGEVRWVEFPLSKENSKFICHNNSVKFEKKENKGQAIVVASYFIEEKSFNCQVMVKDKNVHQINFTVEAKEYKAEQLKVDPKKIKLSPKDEARAAREQDVLNQTYASSLPEIQFKHAFMSPLQSFVTSVYGIKRVYNGMKKGQHLGTDFRAAVGDRIPATNDGKIVFAGDLFYTGWTVIIDHGIDIFTIYGHLSKTLVSTGDVVKKGDIVALSGNTGRSSGPHLHWGVKIQGQYVDGFALIEETKKVFRD